MTAEELLSAEETTSSETSNVITINGKSRNIDIPLGEEFIGVEGDKDVEMKHFAAPKIVGNNIDLSLHNLYVNYALADEKGNQKSKDVISSPCKNIVVNEDTITFDWEISEWVTQEDGYIAFSVVAKQSIDGILNTRWYTTPGVGHVKRTIKEGQELTQQYPDVIDNLMNRVAELEKSIESGGTGGSITVDAELSTESTNPVQNKVITEKVNKLSEEIGDLKGSEVTGISAELTTALRLYFTNIQTLMPQLAYVTEDNVGNAIIQNAKDVVTVLGGGEAEEPTLSSISASYSGGDVVVGTVLTALTGITVTATYSDGTSATVTDYTLSGTIAEGSNTITVSYGGKSTTFTVTGIAESEEIVTYTITRNLTNCTSNSSATSVNENTAHTETITADDGYTLDSATVSVTMGGTDISDKYAEGVLTIDSVTGNVVIAISAVEESSEPVEITTDFTFPLTLDNGFTVGNLTSAIEQGKSYKIVIDGTVNEESTYFEVRGNNQNITFATFPTGQDGVEEVTATATQYDEGTILRVRAYGGTGTINSVMIYEMSE